ncbi:MAG: glycosyltransferase family 39 protein [Candidatus Omnitrophica bacterium]|nr:glycosyltransferase family 39 protein [Candidatus Omnitrophota bacterium]
MNTSVRLQNSYSQLWVIVSLCLIIIFAAVVRVRLLEAPLERDEGEYAYAGQLILEGISPYKGVYSMKMPGVYAAYAMIMSLLGQTRIGIHLGLLFINSATIILVFLLGRRLLNPILGIASAASFAMMSLSESVQGVFANAEHFVILFALGGILLLLYAADSKKNKLLFSSGLLFGAGFLMKQHGGVFILFGIAYLIFEGINRRARPWPGLSSGILLFIMGAVLPFGLMVFLFICTGDFAKFWFWTFTYAREYISSCPLPIGLISLHRNITGIIKAFPLLWVFTGIGLAALFLNKKIRPRSLFIESFLIFSFLSICPGLYFRPHYFILILPAVALLAGIGMVSLGKNKKILISLLISAALLYSGYQNRMIFFKLSPPDFSRMTYGHNPFIESLEIARYIKARTKADDRILVLGSEPQIYFYSGRRSATKYIYVYPLMEDHRYALSMQEEMINDIKRARPEFILFVNIPTSWLMKQKSERLLFDWFDDYSKVYYKKVGMVDIISPRLTVYRWDEESIDYTPRSNTWISIYKSIARF